MKSVSWRRGALSLAACLLASAVFACQTPIPLPKPSGFITYGSLTLGNGASLVLQLDVRPLLAAAQRYSLKDVSTGSQIQKVTATVTGDNITPPGITLSVDVANCVNGMATLNFANLPPGHVHVTLNAIDTSGKIVSWGGSDYTIVEGGTNVVTVNCQPADNGLTVVFDCGLCGGSPASPTPTPVASPHLTHPIDTSSWLGFAYGLTIDQDGTVYIYGVDPGYDPVHQNPVDGCGRILKVVPDDNTPPSVFNDAQISMVEGSIYNGNLMTISDTIVIPGQFPTYTHRTIPLDGSPETSRLDPNITEQPCVNTVDQNGTQIYVESGTSAPVQSYFQILRADSTTNPSALYTSQCDANLGQCYSTPGNPKPISLGWDHTHNQPIWAGAGGLMTVQDPTHTKLLFQSQCLGLALPSDDDSEILFTEFAGNGVISYWSPTTVKTAINFSYGAPQRLNKGLDGFYYALLVQSPHFLYDPTDGFSGDYNYRIIKMSFDATNKVLVPVQTVVDTFPAGSPASF